MQCKNPYFDKKSGLQFNCGKCHACRINYTSMWTLRCLFELDNWTDKGCSFITLTYDDDHLPKDLGLHKEHCQDFFKRLRQNLKRKCGITEIKYRLCGEYGDTEKKYLPFVHGQPSGVALGRPHYHAIVYGLDDMNDEHRQVLIDSWKLSDPYMFDKNRKDNGMLPVCREDIAYVCGYVHKKLNGTLGKETYGIRQIPFSLSSQGLGLDFAKSVDWNRGFTTMAGQKIGIPKYFRDKLGIDQASLIKVNKSKIFDNQDEVIRRFNEYLNSLGLMWLLDDPIRNHKIIERRWYRFYEKQQNEWADFIQSEYEKKRLIRGQKL